MATSLNIFFSLDLIPSFGSEYQMGWNKEPLNKNAWPRAPEADHEKIHKFPPPFRVHLVDSFFHVKKEILFKHLLQFYLLNSSLNSSYKNNKIYYSIKI